MHHTYFVLQHDEFAHFIVAGYSIFALVPASGSGDAAFPRCPAEEVALSLPSPRGGATQYGSTSTAFSGTGYALNGHGHAGPSGSMSGTAQTGTAPFSTLAAEVSAATGSSRKGKRAASYQGDGGDDDDDVIIEESGRSGSSTVDSESEKRRRRRRLDAGAGAGGDANVTSGLSEEDQMAAAIAASLKVSGNGAAGRSDSGADGTAGKSAATQVRLILDPRCNLAQLTVLRVPRGCGLPAALWPRCFKRGGRVPARGPSEFGRSRRSRSRRRRRRGQRHRVRRLAGAGGRGQSDDGGAAAAEVSAVRSLTGARETALFFSPVQSMCCSRHVVITPSQFIRHVVFSRSLHFLFPVLFSRASGPLASVFPTSFLALSRPASAAQPRAC